MSYKSIRIRYSFKNIAYILALVGFFVLMDAILIICNNDALVSFAVTVFVVLLSMFLIYWILNRIKDITLDSGRILINRYLIKNLTFESKDILLVSQDTVKIGRKVFNIKFAENKRELISLLLSAMEIKNIDEATNAIFSGARLYNSQIAMDKAIKQANIASVVSLILMGVAFIATIILNHWGLIFIICTFILMGLFYLTDSLFDTWIQQKGSKIVKLLLKGVIYIIVIGITFVLGVAIYKMFMIWGIDFIKITL